MKILNQVPVTVYNDVINPFLHPISQGWISVKSGKSKAWKVSQIVNLWKQLNKITDACEMLIG